MAKLNADGFNGELDDGSLMLKRYAIAESA